MIRNARWQDYASYARLTRELGLVPSTLDRWRELAPHTLISEHGYATVIALGDAGHVRNLVAANEHGGLALLHAAADELRGRGLATWYGTARAETAHLFEQLGMTLEQRSQIIRVPASRLHELPSEPATVLPVEPDEDDDVERALGLLLGRIAMMRSQGRTLVQLRDAACAPVGFAAIDAGIALPFRVARPALARSLLEAIAQAPHLHVTLEDDPETAAVIRAIGEPTLELLHYRGTLDAVRVAC